MPSGEILYQKVTYKFEYSTLLPPFKGYEGMFVKSGSRFSIFLNEDGILLTYMPLAHLTEDFIELLLGEIKKIEASLM
jgi:hypothetical protein